MSYNSSAFKQPIFPSYIVVSVPRHVDVGPAALHVHGGAPYVRDSVLEVAQIGQQVDDGVSDLLVDRPTIPDTHHRTWVIWNNDDDTFCINYSDCNERGGFFCISSAII